MFEGEFNPDYGHGQIYCSCGTMLSFCKCHKTDYRLIVGCKTCEAKTKKAMVARRTKATPSPKVLKKGTQK